MEILRLRDVDLIIGDVHLQNDGSIFDFLRWVKGDPHMRAVPFDLMDLQMPIMGGIEAARAIRERERSLQQPRIPIIAVTANPDRDACLKAGMDDFVFKPASLDQLSAVLHRFLAPIASGQ